MFQEFNFANVPFRSARLSRFVFTALAAVTLVMTLAHGFVLARHLLREQQDLDIQVVQIRQELQETEQTIAEARRTLQEETNEIRDERTRFLTRLYRRKGFSWTGLFNELEEITPAAVRVTSINPYEEDGELGLNLSLVGRTLDDVIEMVRQLESSDIFDAVFPLEEDELNAERGSGIAATLDLNYIERQAEQPPAASADTPGPDASSEEPGDLEGAEDSVSPVPEDPPMPPAIAPAVNDMDDMDGMDMDGEVEFGSVGEEPPPPPGARP